MRLALLAPVLVAFLAASSPKSADAKPKGAATQATPAQPTATATSAAKARQSAARLPTIANVEGRRGVYVRGDTAARADFDKFLADARAHGIDTLVLDAKDYDGTLTYPSRVPLAVESGATLNAPIEDFAKTIEGAKSRGFHVIVRVSCFEDELMAKARPRLSVQSKAGRAYPIGWLDPSNEAVQGYVVDLVREAIALGADEIQLDYVRYPVLGIKNADFHLEERGLTKTQVIRDFVRKVHAVTLAHRVPLSLDVFGVIAFGKRDDIDRLGQDPVLLAAECEVLSPMVYPSHYAPGFAGLEEPGAHPELVGMALVGLQKQLASMTGRRAILRPWLQAMPWKSSNFSSSYVAREIKSSAEHEGSGFLLWNPGQGYRVAYGGMPRPAAATPSSARPRSLALR